MVYVYLSKRHPDRATEQTLQLTVRAHLRRMSKPPVSDDKLQTARTALGKLYFPALPQLHVSVSHSGEYFVCALSDEPVGIDLQLFSRQEAGCARLWRIARRYFHPTEQRFMTPNPLERFFTLWTARESYVKYTGQGIGKDFSRLCMIPQQQALWPESTPSMWQTQGVWFRQSQDLPGYALCVCTGSPSPWQITAVDLAG